MSRFMLPTQSLSLLLRVCAASVCVLLIPPLSTQADDLAGLGAHRTQDGRLFVFITADTRLDADKSWPFSTLTARNLALEGETYTCGTLWKIWKVWHFLSLPSATAASVVVFIDGDSTFGGCPIEQFAAAYDSIVNASGCPIVVSAEMQCYAPEFQSWHREHRRCAAYSLPPWPERARQGSPLRVTPNPRPSHLINRYPHPPHAPYAYRYLNSGGYAGPPEDLRRMMRWILATACLKLVPGIIQWLWRRLSFFLIPNDQTTMAQYMHEHPQLVTLDYEAQLFLSLWGLDSDRMLHVSARRVTFGANHRPVCFVHDNSGTDHQNLARRIAAATSATAGNASYRARRSRKMPHAKPAAAAAPEMRKLKRPMTLSQTMGMTSAAAVVIVCTVAGYAAAVCATVLLVCHLLSCSHAKSAATVYDRAAATHEMELLTCSAA